MGALFLMPDRPQQGGVIGGQGSRIVQREAAAGDDIRQAAVFLQKVGGKLWGQPALLHRTDSIYRDVVLFCHTVKPFL